MVPDTIVIPMDTSFTNSRESLQSATRCNVNWETLGRGEQIRSIELDGFVVIPNLIPPELQKKVQAEMDRLPTVGTDYSEYQRGCVDVQWTDSREAIQMIAHSPVLEFLTELFGDELICTSCHFTISLPGHPGIAVAHRCATVRFQDFWAPSQFPSPGSSALLSGRPDA